MLRVYGKEMEPEKGGLKGEKEEERQTLFLK